MKLDIVCVVWGAKYVNIMLDYCFASLLAPGNVPDWPHQTETIFHIYTTAMDELTIQQSHVYQQLKQYIKFQFHINNNDVNQNHEDFFHRLNKSHQNAILDARQRKAALMYIAPDHVFSMGCFITIASVLQSGAKLVMALTPRVDMSCVNELEILRTAACLTLLPEVATDLFATHLHPLAKSLFWEQDIFNTWCSQVYCFLDPFTIMARGFHLHPLVMVNPIPFQAYHKALDADYLASYSHSKDKIHVATDNQLFILSLTQTINTTMQNSYFSGPLTHTHRQLWLDRYYRLVALDIHRWFFSKCIVLRGTGKRTLQPDPKFDCVQAIDAIQAYWNLEAAALAEKPVELTFLYKKHQNLILEYLAPVFQKACNSYFDMAAASLLHATS